MHPRSKENRVRRVAHRLGLRLEKSRAHDPHESTFVGYMLVYVERNEVAYGAAGHEYSLTLAGVEDLPETSREAGKEIRRNHSTGLSSAQAT
jgi:hypothetical protein